MSTETVQLFCRQDQGTVNSDGDFDRPLLRHASIVPTGSVAAAGLGADPLDTAHGLEHLVAHERDYFVATERAPVQTTWCCPVRPVPSSARGEIRTLTERELPRGLRDYFRDYPVASGATARDEREAANGPDRPRPSRSGPSSAPEFSTRVVEDRQIELLCGGELPYKQPYGPPHLVVLHGFPNATPERSRIARRQGLGAFEVCSEVASEIEPEVGAEVG